MSIEDNVTQNAESHNLFISDMKVPVPPFYERLLRLIYPARCIFCRDILWSDEAVMVCEYCCKSLEPISAQWRAMKNIGIDGFYAPFYYLGAVENAIRTMKYENQPKYSETFAQILADRLRMLEPQVSMDYIVPVPMHKQKEIERGYNQAVLIAEWLVLLHLFLVVCHASQFYLLWNQAHSP